MSKAAYGWVARWPTLKISKKVWAAVHVGSRRMVSAAPWLRAALFGGNTHLDVVFATRLVGTCARARLKKALKWVAATGSPSHALNTWLRRRGWTRQRP